MNSNERLNNLEMKISYLENTLDELNSKILEQNTVIADLQNEIFLMKERFEDNSEDIRLQEKPPHY